MSDCDKPGLALFEGYGIELEYMIVDRATLDVSPISDALIHQVTGSYASEVERGPIAWSNELVLHVIELKTNGPAASLDSLAPLFHDEVRAVDRLLADMGARLMPTAMHPWMDPARHTRLWPHEYSAVYATFDAIFDCRGHGWSNLQSMHINLPYRGDEELRRLHSAIRLVLPLLPAIAASSPIIEGRATGKLDSRLAAYRNNCRRYPSVTGRVVPEVVTSAADYRDKILDPIQRDLGPHDPGAILDPEWVNARGAIVRFVRDSIEIRVIDIQETPKADLAIAALAVGAVRVLTEERFADLARQETLATEDLEAVLNGTIDDGERAAVPAALAACFGAPSGVSTAEDLWRHIAGEVALGAHGAVLEVILERGPLARRILEAVNITRSDRAVYEALSDHLVAGEIFVP